MNSSKNRVWQIVIILLIFLALFVHNTRKVDVRYLELQKEYPTLQKQTELKGMISYQYDFLANNFRDGLSVSMVLIGRERYTIIADEIEGYNDYGINEVISIGDFIYKEKGNDTIILKKKDSNKNYFFLRRNKMY